MGYQFGLISSQGSGVVTIQGLLLSYVGQVFRMSDAEKVSTGTIVNLSRDDTMNLLVSGLQFQPEVRVYIGGKVQAQPNLSTVILGDFVIGSLLDPLGSQLLSTNNPRARNQWVIESPAIGIVDRQSVFEPIQTGLLSIDSMIPIGRGQRELILGDRYTGKTSIGVDTILNQKYEKVLCIYLPLGQKASSILEIFLALIRRDAIRYLSFLVASAASSA